jgi:hypothetical protein
MCNDVLVSVLQVAEVDAPSMHHICKDELLTTTKVKESF